MSDYSNWDEFQWETEIRRHEHDVADFFQGLVYCLDLPLDNMPGTWNNSAVQSAPVVAGDNPDPGVQWPDECYEDNGCEPEREYEQRRPSFFSCVDALDQLASEWNQFIVRFENRAIQTHALGISCAFAKLLARTADFTEPSAKFYSIALQVSLGKRALTDIADLLTRLERFSQTFAEHSGSVNGFRQRLMLLRDQLVDKLFELRNSDKPPF